jgi:hypothetical protein
MFGMNKENIALLPDGASAFAAAAESFGLVHFLCSKHFCVQIAKKKKKKLKATLQSAP